VWFKEAELANVNITWRNRNSWRGTGTVETEKAGTEKAASVQAPNSSGNTA